MDKRLAYIIYYLCLVSGLGSLMFFTVFLFTGPFNFIDLKLNIEQAMIFDAGLCLVFFLQHSIMVRKSIRKKLPVPDQYSGAVYAIASGVVLTILVVFWQTVPVIIFSAEGIAYWAFRLLFFIGCAGVTWGMMSLNDIDLIGAKKIRYFIKDKKPRSSSLLVKGAYRWLRHPLYFFMLIIFWSYPVFTPDKLLFNILWTVWVIAATILEERDMVTDFGESYKQYQGKVPMLLPYKIPD